MSRNKSSFPNKIWRLSMALLIALPAVLATAVTDVQAGGGGPIPIISLIVSLDKRNKVYKTANSFIKEKNQYYDTLRDTARQQLLDREFYTIALRESQVAAYIKVVELIEQERQSMLGFAESEKKAARSEFIHALQEEVKGRLLASTPATQLLGALTKGISSSQGFLDTALNKISGGGGGFMGDVQKVKRIAERMTIAGGLIGGNVGKAIQKLGGNVVDLINKPTAEIEADLIKVQGELGELGDYFSGLQDQGYAPRTSQTTRDVVISLVTGESGDPAIAAIADMLVAKHGGGGDFRDRARAIMLGNASARCAARIEQIRQIVYRLEVDSSGGTADDMSDIPTCETIDIADLVESIEGVPEAEDSPPEDPAEVEAGMDADSGQAADASGPSESTDPGADTSASSDTGTISSEFVWVLADTTANPNNEKSAFYGGGKDPDWFAEARFEGKSLVYGCSANNFTMHEVEVDYEYVYHDITVGVDFDSPPARLDPGQDVDLKAFASSSGTVNEGGNGSGLRFQYHLNSTGLDPVLQYFPWAANFDGKSSENWSFTAPAASEGGEFTVVAGLWNAPPCHVVWTYQAQAVQTVSAQPDWESSSELPRRYTPEQCREKQSDVASKVSIARGADTADLELGVIGYVVGQMGSARIGYCEGGEAQSQKGIPIRIGDCLQTGSDGRIRVRMNDLDNTTNRGPSHLNMGTNSLMCFNDFSVHRDDGKPGLIDHLKGAIRVITEGWSPGSGFGVNVGIKAAVIVASDVVLEYDPETDSLYTYVSEGSVEVTDTASGQKQILGGDESLAIQGPTVGEVEKIKAADWDRQIKALGLDVEDEDGPSDSVFSDLKDRLALPGWIIALITAGVCGGGVLLALIIGGILLSKRKRKNKPPEA